MNPADRQHHVREVVVEKRVHDHGFKVATLKPFRGWNERGYLPHCDKAGLIQMVTYRLADSLPEHLRHEWEPITRIDEERERRQKLEEYLDRGHGECHLRRNDVADLVEENLLRFDGLRYRLLAWVVMPNHVHLMIEQWEPLSKLVKAWKSYTAAAANRVLGRSGAFWQTDYWDRFIRDGRHFATALHYIEHNPVKAGLCSDRAEWFHGGAHPRHHWSTPDTETRLLRGHLMEGAWLGRSAEDHVRKSETLDPESALVWDATHHIVRNLHSNADSRT